ncbi:MAG: nitronate monooxygenase [Deltaproteobacteria bacterium]|nr:nitronate monooxygenase [Deltaproteobacteria bacterium]
MKTKITEMLGIKHPIIQSGMNYAARPPLVAAVSNAGGLGILGALSMRPDDLKEAIAQVRDLTDKPFGVNFLPYHPEVDQMIDVMIDQKVPVASYGRGNPKHIIDRTKASGMLNLPTLGSVKHAIRAEQDGADGAIIQGTEAGGHSSYVSTTVLLPKTVDAVKIPIVAAGGFCDGRGLVAALAFGAEGISMGTRFILTRECTVADSIKRSFQKANENDTIITDKVTGMRCRGLNNQLVRLLETQSRGAKLLSFFKAIPAARTMGREFGVSPWKLLLTGMKMRDAYEMAFNKVGYASFSGSRIKAALENGDEDMGFMPCGQVCGRIDDIPTVKELIERIVAEAEAILEKITPSIRDR